MLIILYKSFQLIDLFVLFYLNQLRHFILGLFIKLGKPSSIFTQGKKRNSGICDIHEQYI